MIKKIAKSSIVFGIMLFLFLYLLDIITSGGDFKNVAVGTHLVSTIIAMVIWSVVLYVLFKKKERLEK